MKRVRARKPTKLRLLHGDDKKHPERINRREPEPPPLASTCPDRLKDRESRAKWDEMWALLEPLGVLTEADKTALEMFCKTWGDYCKVQAQVDRHGVVDTSGRRSAWAVELHTLKDELRKMMMLFGLTPGSRSTIVADSKSAQDDPLTHLFRERYGKGS